MTGYDPAAELARAKSRRDRQFDLRWRKFENDLHLDGAADREVLGVPEPEQPWRPANSMQAWGAAAAAFNDALAQIGRDIAIGLARGRR